MASFSPQQNTFISTLAGHTGLNPGVVAAWVAAEEPVGAPSGYHGTQDWLNVGITDSGPMGAGNSVWRDPKQAAIATANWIRGTWTDPGFGNAAPGIRAIMGTVGKSPQEQIKAIQNSGWASGGYSDLPSLYSMYASQAPKADATASIARQMAMPSSGPSPTSVPGQTSTDWASAITAALMREASSPISDNGNVKIENPLGDAISLASSGAFNTTSAPTTPAAKRAISGAAVVDAASAGANQDAQKLLAMLHSVNGGPYSQGNHDAVGENAAQVKSQGTDCSGLISWLMGPSGLGIWHTSLATPDIANAPGLHPGRGAVITVWNNKQPGNAGHVFIQIGNQYWASEGGVGIRQISSAEAQNYIQHGSDGGTYQPLHPTGL